jgi:hypothetical protein
MAMPVDAMRIEQVNEDNEAAYAVYRKFAFDTVYTYHYRARPRECA